MTRLPLLLPVLALAAASLTPAVAAEPLPKAGCSTFTDTKGDSKYAAANGVTTFDNDPDVDLVGLALRATATDLWAYLRVDDLVDYPRNGFGHRFDVKFLVNAKVFSLVHAAPNPNYDTINGIAYPFVIAAGSYDEEAPVTATFDKDLNLVTYRLPLSYIATKAAVPVAKGTQLTGVLGRGKLLTTSISSNNPSDGADTLMDTVQDPDAAKAVWTVGDNKCFAPPPSKLGALTGLAVQYGDSASLSARLTDEAGTAGVAGRKLTFTAAGRSVVATTDANGVVAKVALAHGRTAGSYPLTVSFAGDDTAGPATLTGTLVVRPEAVTLRATAGGGKVTATLTDDDKRPVAGQRVTFTVGRGVTSLTTNARGEAALSRLKKGQSVKVEFPAVAGRYNRAGPVTTRV